MTAVKVSSLLHNPGETLKGEMPALGIHPNPISLSKVSLEKRQG